MSIVTHICVNFEEIEQLSETNLDAAHAKVYEKVLENTLNNLVETS